MPFDPLRFVRPSAPRIPEDRQKRIAEAAYLKSLNRGFEPGHEMEDWLAAESEQGVNGREKL